MNKPIGASGGNSVFLKFVSTNEQYGEHVIKNYLSSIQNGDIILDIGAGSGRDLNIAQQAFPSAELHGLEFSPSCCEALSKKGIITFQTDIEKEQLPFKNCFFDIIISNQVMEHLKDIFFTLHEMARTLKVGGHMIIGVPNVASFHNRILLLLGRHPSQAKSYSAHVRTFSYHDTKKLFEVAGGGAFSITKFSGSQFYPLPRSLSRVASSIFPQLAFSIFFLIKKESEYTNSFYEYGKALTASVFCNQDIDK
ncbi:class I SAM-dependent methyltransferase [Desulfovibrio mangrovi]|uniref:class I SAM-dependent methyltransferase n=1 Tax=Desulfovibrio mangrovi TaxID=2976983 RepID=UPI002245F362|nr:class I SAM-dependent methyltransferase [Desulfovibrio mangrovi]UZP67841.1 class I SAM-dependent methyltransferase [Desulfovibrio mangrovi]